MFRENCFENVVSDLWGKSYVSTKLLLEISLKTKNHKNVHNLWRLIRTKPVFFCEFVRPAIPHFIVEGIEYEGISELLWGKALYEANQSLAPTLTLKLKEVLYFQSGTDWSMNYWQCFKWMEIVRKGSIMALTASKRLKMAENA